MVAAGNVIYAEDINERGIVYQGNRSGNSSASSGSTEAGVLRIDNMVLKAGLAYEFKMGGFRIDFTVAGDRAVTRLRYNSAGTATTSSAEIGRQEKVVNTVSGTPNDDLQSPGPVVGWVIPGATTTAASVIFTLVRAGGTGTCTIQVDNGGLWLSVICHGPAVADTGVDL